MLLTPTSIHNFRLYPVGRIGCRVTIWTPV